MIVGLAFFLFGQLLCFVLLTLLLMLALCKVYIMPWIRQPWRGISLALEWFSEHHPVLPTVEAYIRNHGYQYEEFDVTTEDGFILQVQHIFKSKEKDSNEKDSGSEDEKVGRGEVTPPVILCHGLMQSSSVFVVDDDDSLAFHLVEMGLDVWLVNNRGSSKLEHTKHSKWSEEFWDWSIQELARYDFPAFVDFVLSKTGHSKVSWVGHSQGNAQAFGALAMNPQLSEKINILLAIAPAACVRPTLCFSLKTVFSLPHAVWYKLFGKKAFIPLHIMLMSLFSAKAFAVFGYSMFSHLFYWSDTRWRKGRKHRYFQFTPQWVSSKCILHWGQMLKAGQLTFYDDAKQHGEKMDLSKVKCPVSLIYGDQDLIIDPDSLRNQLDPSVLRHVQRVEGYEHMDALWAYDAPDTLFPLIVKLLQ